MTDDPPDNHDDADEGDDSSELASQQPTVSAADLSTIKGKQALKARLIAETMGFWRACLGTPVGRRVLWDLLANQCHIFEDRFGVGPTGFPNEIATWFHAGERSVGLRTYRTLLRIDLEGVQLMHREHDSSFAEPKPIRRKRSV